MTAYAKRQLIKLQKSNITVGPGPISVIGPGPTVILLIGPLFEIATLLLSRASGIL